MGLEGIYLGICKIDQTPEGREARLGMVIYRLCGQGVKINGKLADLQETMEHFNTPGRDLLKLNRTKLMLRG